MYRYPDVILIIVLVNIVIIIGLVVDDIVITPPLAGLRHGPGHGAVAPRAIEEPQGGPGGPQKSQSGGPWGPGVAGGA